MRSRSERAAKKTTPIDASGPFRIRIHGNAGGLRDCLGFLLPQRALRNREGRLDPGLRRDHVGMRADRLAEIRRHSGVMAKPCSAWTGEAMLRMDGRSHAAHGRPESRHVAVFPRGASVAWMAKGQGEPRRPVFRQIAARLAHRPDRRRIEHLAVKRCRKLPFALRLCTKPSGEGAATIRQMKTAPRGCERPFRNSCRKMRITRSPRLPSRPRGGPCPRRPSRSRRGRRAR